MVAGSPQVIPSLSELRRWREGRAQTVGFVPTMGALHAGHLELLKRSKRECDLTVLSIFVNPTQFGPTEDFAHYPRSLDADLQAAQSCGADVVYVPGVKEIYPDGYSTTVEVTGVSEPLCGSFRPGHFRGVATVVVKLLNQVAPRRAYFGLKDAQQFFVIQKLVRDLDLAVEVIAVPTVREPDGLAMSSRNRYLSTEERERAPLFYRALSAAASDLGSGAPPGEALAIAIMNLKRGGFDIQYLECRKIPNLEALSEDEMQNGLRKGVPYLLAGAVFLGKTRLIDNVAMGYELEVAK